MRFLFVRPEFCPLGDLSTPKIRLSSDSTSRWTPLPLASPSRYRADSGLSPYRTCAHRAHINVEEDRSVLLHFLAALHNSARAFGEKCPTKAEDAIMRRCPYLSKASRSFSKNFFRFGCALSEVASSNLCSRSFCSRVRRVGVSTTTVTYWSPRLRPLT